MIEIERVYPINYEDLKEPLKEYMNREQKEEYVEKFGFFDWIGLRMKFIFQKESFNEEVRTRAKKFAFMMSQINTKLENKWVFYHGKTERKWYCCCICGDNRCGECLRNALTFKIMPTCPEDNILNASSVKKDDSGINKNDYKSLPKPEPNITLNIINEISTIGDSNPLNNNIIYEKMEKKDSNFDDIYFNEYDFFNRKNIFDNLNSELNDYLDNQKNNTLEFLILEPLDILPNDFDDNSKVKKKFKIDKGQNSLGHKKKGNKEECKHTKYDNDNASNKLIIQCMKILMTMSNF